MKHKTLWLVSGLILIAAGVQFLARKAPTTKSSTPPPASVSKIEGTDLKRLTLLPEAARRLDIKTALLREEPFVPTRKVGGEVVSTPDPKTAVVQVNLTENELKRVRQAEPAFILPLAHENKGAAPIKVLRVPTPPGLSGLPGSIFYQVSSTHGFVRRQLVFVEIPLIGSSEKRKMVPYAAVLYNPHGNTWVYANPEPLVYVRQSISIDSIHGDQVLLSAGPPAGTSVVTVGGAELYGTEFGVGK